MTTTLVPDLPSDLDLTPSEGAPSAQGLLVPSDDGVEMTIALPQSVVAAGKRTTLAFYLAFPSFIKSLRWVPGFKLEKLSIGTSKGDQKDYGDGMQKADGRYYHEHRVLKRDVITMTVLNHTTEDRAFSGNMTLETSNVIEDTNFTCSLASPAENASDDAAARMTSVAST